MQPNDIDAHAQKIRNRLSDTHTNTHIYYRATCTDTHYTIISIHREQSREFQRIMVPTKILHHLHAIAQSATPHHPYTIVFECHYPTIVTGTSTLELHSPHHTPNTVYPMEQPKPGKRMFRIPNPPSLHHITPTDTLTDIRLTMQQRIHDACAFIYTDSLRPSYASSDIKHSHEINSSFIGFYIHIRVAGTEHPDHICIELALVIRYMLPASTQQSNIVLKTPQLTMDILQPAIAQIMAEQLSHAAPYDRNDSAHQHIKYLRTLQEYSTQPPEQLLNDIQLCVDRLRQYYPYHPAT